MSHGRGLTVGLLALGALGLPTLAPARAPALHDPATAVLSDRLAAETSDEIAPAPGAPHETAAPSGADTPPALLARVPSAGYVSPREAAAPHAPGLRRLDHRASLRRVLQRAHLLSGEPEDASSYR